METQLNVLIADDHQLFRHGFASLLSQLPFIGCIFQAENGKIAVELLEKEKIDIVFMDVSMPVLNGTQATRLIKKKNPNIKIIALSMYDDKNSVMEMIAFGAEGYLTKNTDLEEIKMAISNVMENKKYFTPEIAQNILNGVYSNENEIIHLKNLGIITSQEREIMVMLSDGLNAEQIGNKMNVSHKTIEAHKAMLYRKTGTNNVANLIKYAFRNKLIEW